VSASTGPILAAGAIVAFNGVVINGENPMAHLRTGVATAIAAGGLFMFEQVSRDGAVALAWLVLVATLIVRVDPSTPSPVESFARWYREGS
jgi:hypothetical protein